MSIALRLCVRDYTCMCPLDCTCFAFRIPLASPPYMQALRVLVSSVPHLQHVHGWCRLCMSSVCLLQPDMLFMFLPNKQLTLILLCVCLHTLSLLSLYSLSILSLFSPYATVISPPPASSGPLHPPPPLCFVRNHQRKRCTHLRSGNALCFLSMSLLSATC